MSAQHSESSIDPKTSQPAYCRHCNYSLLGLPGTICPECGTEFDRNNPRTFRRRPGGWGKVIRIWLRRLIASTICFAILASAGLLWLWWGWRLEQPAVRQLEDLGAGVAYKPVLGPPFEFLAKERYGHIGGRVDLISLRDHTSPDQIENVDLISLTRLKSVICNEVKLSDADIANLARVKTLEVLIMDWVGVNDSELARISNLKNLWFLDIKGSSITDSGIVYLQRLTQLRRLSVTSPNITDSGIANLKSLQNLELLGVGPSSYPSNGPSKGVTMAGIKKLQDALPRLQNR